MGRSKTINDRCKSFKGLHVPGHPILLANVYDVASANAVAALPPCEVLAISSSAFAESLGKSDNELRTQVIYRAPSPNFLQEAKSLTVDTQGGYGDKLAPRISTLIKMPFAGVDFLEGFDNSTGQMMPRAKAASRCERVVLEPRNMEAQTSLGMPALMLCFKANALAKP